MSRFVLGEPAVILQDRDDEIGIDPVMRRRDAVQPPRHELVHVPGILAELLVRTAEPHGAAADVRRPLEPKLELAELFESDVGKALQKGCGKALGESLLAGAPAPIEYSHAR